MLNPSLDDPGDVLNRALREHAEAIGDSQGRLRDQQTQLSVMAISVQALRNEVLERIDMAEKTVLQQLAQLEAQLRSIVSLLRSSGNGHV